MKEANFKYGEMEYVDELQEYLASTYGQHYIGQNNVQLFDLILAGDPDEARGFFRWNAMKYLTRQGKKEGNERKDLLKAMHYTILMMHLEDRVNAQPSSSIITFEEKKEKNKVFTFTKLDPLLSYIGEGVSPAAVLVQNQSSAETIFYYMRGPAVNIDSETLRKSLHFLKIATSWRDESIPYNEIVSSYDTTFVDKTALDNSVITNLSNFNRVYF